VKVTRVYENRQCDTDLQAMSGLTANVLQHQHFAGPLLAQSLSKFFNLAC